MSYSEQVRRIKDILRQGWHKGSYFAVRGDVFCCCVHGAGQTLCNPLVHTVIGERTLTALSQTELRTLVHRVLVGVAQSSAATSADEALQRVKKGESYQLAWRCRSERIQKSSFSHYGDVGLHYLLGMFGITASFNDADETTLEMMLDRLDQCAAWASENEEYLANN